ncbi:MAG: LuxR family transcriptional regulator [Streptosporangiaceae bacterium]|jgi:hypothetical protein|nr:LuxR family transcriptional regulator [Streptosporangiaceae bacterium]
MFGPHQVEWFARRALAISIGEEAGAVCDAYGEGWHKAYTMMALGIALHPRSVK